MFLSDTPEGGGGETHFPLVIHPKFIIFNAESITLNTKFIIFDTKFNISDAKFIVLQADNPDRNEAQFGNFAEEIAEFSIEKR